jgi:hypothetical protein
MTKSGPGYLDKTQARTAQASRDKLRPQMATSSARSTTDQQEAALEQASARLPSDQQKQRSNKSSHSSGKHVHYGITGTVWK